MSGSYVTICLREETFSTRETRWEQQENGQLAVYDLTGVSEGHEFRRRGHKGLPENYSGVFTLHRGEEFKAIVVGSIQAQEGMRLIVCEGQNAPPDWGWAHDE